MAPTAPLSFWLTHSNTPKKHTQHAWSPLEISAEPSTASASPHYKWPRPDWAFPQNGPLSSSSWTSTEPHQYGSRFHNSLMTKQAKQDYPASNPSEQQTSYSPPNEGYPKVMSPAHLDGNAVYDILLRALTIQRRHITDPSTQVIAYADDLLSVSSTIASLQKQAELVAGLGPHKIPCLRIPIPSNPRTTAPNASPHPQNQQCGHFSPTNGNTHVPGQPI